MLDSQTREWLSKPSCSVAQAAKMLGLSRPGIINAVDRGEITGTRLGRRIVIPTAAIRKILHIDEAAMAEVSTQASPSRSA